jgi:hypothetical protein
MTHSGHSDIGKYEKAALALSGDRSTGHCSLASLSEAAQGRRALIQRNAGFVSGLLDMFCPWQRVPIRDAHYAQTSVRDPRDLCSCRRAIRDRKLLFSVIHLNNWGILIEDNLFIIYEQSMLMANSIFSAS